MILKTHEYESLSIKYGTPLYIFSSDELKKRFLEIQSAFKTKFEFVELAWSIKTNPSKLVGKTLSKLGASAEVAGELDIESALECGFDPEYIYINGPTKSQDTLEWALSYGATIQADSREELIKILNIATKRKKIANVILRLRPSMPQLTGWNRFGMDIKSKDLVDFISGIVSNENFNFRGIHFHLGSNIHFPRHYEIATKEVMRFGSRLEQKSGRAINALNIGGGFASRMPIKKMHNKSKYSQPPDIEYAQAIEKGLRKTRRNGFKQPKIIVECGRSLLETCFSLLCKVEGIKNCDTPIKQIFLDTGINSLSTATYLEHPIQLVSVTKSKKHEPVMICGPLPMPQDVIRTCIKLPILHEGDLLLISNVGAYCQSFSWDFVRRRPQIYNLGEEVSSSAILQKDRDDTSGITFNQFP